MRTIYLLVALAGCTATDERTVEVTESNALSIRSLVISRSDGVFELRAFDATDVQRADVRVRTGLIDELGGDGTEITLSVDGETSRTITRETEWLVFRPALSPSSQAFFALPAVSSTLERDAHLVIDTSPGVPEIGLATQTCAAGNLVTAPIARQCCQYALAGSSWTLFYGNTAGYPSYLKIVVRRNNPHGTTCKAADGVSACSGSACYYGPYGWSKPGFSNPPTPYFSIVPESEPNDCIAMGSQTPVSPSFGDVTGNKPTGAGCPGGATGAGQWDW